MFTPSPKKTCLIFTEGHSDLEFFDAFISLTAPSFLTLEVLILFMEEEGALRLFYRTVKTKGRRENMKKQFAL